MTSDGSSADFNADYLKMASSTATCWPDFWEALRFRVSMKSLLTVALLKPLT